MGRSSTERRRREAGQKAKLVCFPGRDHIPGTNNTDNVSLFNWAGIYRQWQDHFGLSLQVGIRIIAESSRVHPTTKKADMVW